MKCNKIVITCIPTTILIQCSVIHTIDKPTTCSNGCSLPASVYLKETTNERKKKKYIHRIHLRKYNRMNVRSTIARQTTTTTTMQRKQIQQTFDKQLTKTYPRFGKF